MKDVPVFTSVFTSPIDGLISYLEEAIKTMEVGKIDEARLMLVDLVEGLNNP